MMKRKSVLLLGAAGFIGGECLKPMLREGTYEHITILTRSPFRSTVFKDPLKFMGHSA